MNLKNKICLILALLLPFSISAEVTEMSVKTCAKIDNDLKRLSCFDKVAELMTKDIRIKIIDSIDEVPTTSHAVKAPKTSQKATPKIAQKNTNNTFGLEQKIAKEGPDTIESEIDGEFTGWNGHTVFHLSNGQVWKQSQPGRLFHKATNPKVIIKKKAFGSYRLKVEGANARVYVKRIK